MNSSESSTISCDFLERFDDDSGPARVQAESSLVPSEFAASTQAPPEPAAGRWASPRSRFSPPSEREAKAAKKFWREALRRFTEPVPGKKGRLRGTDSEEKSRPRITVEYGDTATGHELDVADKGCLVLLSQAGPVQGKNGLTIEESAVLIPWTEILNIRFTVYRPVEQKPKPDDSAA